MVSSPPTPKPSGSAPTVGSGPAPSGTTAAAVAPSSPPRPATASDPPPTVGSPAAPASPPRSRPSRAAPAAPSLPPAPSTASPPAPGSTPASSVSSRPTPFLCRVRAPVRQLHVRPVPQGAEPSAPRQPGLPRQRTEPRPVSSPRDLAFLVHEYEVRRQPPVVRGLARPGIGDAQTAVAVPPLRIQLGASMPQQLAERCEDI